MTLHWPLLGFSAIFAIFAVGSLLWLQRERREGQAYAFFLFRPATWTPKASPLLFKFRMAMNWLFFAIFTVLALVEFAGFLGMIN